MMQNLSLIADFGATFSRLALYADGEIFSQVTLKSRQFQSPLEVIEHYLSITAKNAPHAPDHYLIAIASPLVEDAVQLTNNHWGFSQKALREALKKRGGTLTLINDFKALAYSLLKLEPANLRLIGTSEADLAKSSNSSRNAPIIKALIGPGSGFGTATLVVPTSSISPHSEPVIIASEGGHSVFAPFDQEEIALLSLLSNTPSLLKRKRTPYPIILEDLLSGTHGVKRLIDAMALLYDKNPTFNSPETLIHSALTKKEPFARVVLTRYSLLLATIASNIALTTGARDGIYIGGGLVPRFADFLANSPFRERFEENLTVNNYLKTIPTYLIEHANPTLIGLQYLADRLNQPSQ
ncbi:MAG: hypothetical protein GX667_07760 [Xanthomonadaceae bacterium]|nr:hypothetical protein [Xanthomonadaceae bacterium]